MFSHRSLPQCTALRRLPVPETLLRTAAAGEPPEDPVWFANGYAACELAEGHDGDHADHLWDVEGPDAAMWLRWHDDGGGGHRFATLAWCTTAHPGGDPCELYAGHPPGHSWAVADPTHEALTADMAAHPEHWGLPPHQPG
ncbi:hypothetical protein [Streptomyces sp. NPDC050560]|uniref:hypothetical protein n=1 Tax=Streptomyces sp. NPDC050560 TaxID=3365630 RepID=UPI0037968690